MHERRLFRWPKSLTRRSIAGSHDRERARRNRAYCLVFAERLPICRAGRRRDGCAGSRSDVGRGRQRLLVRFTSEFPAEFRQHRTAHRPQPSDRRCSDRDARQREYAKRNVRAHLCAPNLGSCRVIRGHPDIPRAAIRGKKPNRDRCKPRKPKTISGSEEHLFAIEVGPPVFRRPPRKSRRAVFPHRARQGSTYVGRLGLS